MKKQNKRWTTKCVQMLAHNLELRPNEMDIIYMKMYLIHNILIYMVHIFIYINSIIIHMKILLFVASVASILSIILHYYLQPLHITI